MEKKLCILGSTGSIGEQAIESALHLGYKITGISANRSVKILEQQIRKLKPDFCAVADEDAAKDLKIRINDTKTSVIAGENAASELAFISDASVVLNSIIGFAGLSPTLSAIDSGKDIAIANKETLVSAGEVVMGLARQRGINILPVDSEHCALHQCIGNSAVQSISKLILTASGGPFFGKKIQELKDVTVEQALLHPNWSMGTKITIDSATLVNKGLELIEAIMLFNLPEDKIDVVVHRESIIHSMVEFIDNSVLAQMSVPDMKLSIQYALSYPKRQRGLTEPLNLAKIGQLTFYEPDNDTFPSINLARKAARSGGIMPCIYNAANEACVSLFLERKISFLEIFNLIESAMDSLFYPTKDISIELIIQTDKKTREFCLQTC